MRNPFRRRRVSLLIAAVLVLALAVALWFRAKSPPEAARLLPEADAVVFVHLKTLRTFTHFESTPVQRSPDYQHFIQATGIDPERDIDSFAFALHQMPDANGPNGAVGYSEVFIGRFDAERLQRFLADSASSRETYAGRTVYTIPSDGRTLRVVQLGYDTVGASNMPTAEQIHSMLDRSRTSALSSSGSSLLTAHFHDVPLLSAVWGVGHIGLPLAEHGHISVLGLELPLPADADLVASVRYKGSVQLRVEEFAPDALAAQHTVDALTPLLGILRGLAAAQPAHNGADAAMRDALAAAELEARGSHALLTTSVELDPLKQWLTAPPPPEPLPTTPAAGTDATPAAPAASKH